MSILETEECGRKGTDCAKIEKPYYYTFADLDEYPVGRCDEWPQHVTLTPPQTERGDMPFDSIIDKMAKHVHNLGRISVNTGAYELFGPNHDIGVYRTSGPEGDLARLHHLLMECFNGTPYESIIDHTYTGANYHPHTTLPTGRDTITGIIHVDSVTIGRSTNEGKELYAKLPLYPGAIF